jgi:3-oxoacyl-[acyl-carrier protein] reductase
LDGRSKVINNQQVALVSGSTKGIGKAIARQLVLDGYIVVQNSRSKVTPDEVIGDYHLRADVTIENQSRVLIEKVLEKYGKLNLLVCNVGSGKVLSNEISNSDGWNHFLSVNLLSTTSLVNAALESLKETKGNVVAISSICAGDPTIDAPIGYSTAKAGLEMFIKAMAVRNGKFGVRFNVISPGNVLFEGSVWEQKLKVDNLVIQSYLDRQVPLGKFIEPQDIACAVSFLAGPSGRNITGVILPVDGGQSL